MRKIKKIEKFLYENLLKEHYNINEALEVASDIVDILKRYGYSEPTNDQIEKIEPSEKQNMMNVTKIDKQGRERVQPTKITKMLKALYPDIDLTGDTEVQKLINELKLLTGGKKERYRFETYDDVVHWYKKIKTEYGVGSCVVDNGRVESGETDRLLRGINKLDDLKIVVIWDEEKKSYVGRALLWTKGVIGAGGKPYLDRTYPGNDEQMHSIFVNWAEKQGYDYRSSMSYDGFYSVSGKSQRIRFNCGKIIDEDIVVFPYMDTFRFCTVHPKTGKITLMNYRPNARVSLIFLLGGAGGTRIYTKPVCDVCGESLKRTSEIHQTTEYKRVCDNCFSNFHNCYVCGRDYKTNGKSDEILAGDKMTFHSDADDYICTPCASQKFKQCSKCHRYDFYDEYEKYINVNGSNGFICPDCISRHNLKVCNECGSYSDKILKINVDGNTYDICQNCSDKFVECQNCRDLFYGNDLWYSNSYLFNSCFCDPCFKKLSDKYKKDYGDQFYQENIVGGFTWYDDLTDEQKNNIKNKVVVKEGLAKNYNDLYTNILAEMSECIL